MQIVDDRIIIFRNALTNTTQKRLNKVFNDTLEKSTPVRDGCNYNQYYLDSYNQHKAIPALQKYKDMIVKSDSAYNFEFDTQFLLAYKQDYVECINKFKKDDLMGYHFDKWSNFNLTASIGHSIRFLFKGSRKVERVLEIHSGDIILFNGNAVQHTVKTIQKGRDKCPKWFKSNLGVYRYNLQLRKRNDIKTITIPNETLSQFSRRTVSSRIKRRSHQMKLRMNMRKR